MIIVLHLKQCDVLFRVKTTITPPFWSNCDIIYGILFKLSGQCRKRLFAGWYSVKILYMIGVTYELNVAPVPADVDEYLKGTSHA